MNANQFFLWGAAVDNNNNEKGNHISKVEEYDLTN